MIIFPNQKLDGYDIFAFFENVFSQEECERLRSSFNFKAPLEAKLSDGSIDYTIRKSLLNWIASSKENHWIFDRIAKVAMGCNDARWKFQLSGFTEGIQFGHYKHGGFYNWHQDNGNGETSKRKLSIVVNLSKPEEYEGGNLEFAIGGRAPKSEGSVIVFPSYQVHRVTPIISGQRFSFAAWISGDSYK